MDLSSWVGVDLQGYLYPYNCHQSQPTFTTLYLFLFASYNIIEKIFYIFSVSFVVWRFKMTGVSQYVLLLGHKKHCKRVTLRLAG